MVSSQLTFDKIHVDDLPANVPTIIYGDTLKVLPTFGSNRFDLLICDEPYKDLEVHRAKGTTTRLKKSEGSSMDWYDTIEYKDVIPHYGRILKENRMIWFWRPTHNEESNVFWTELTAHKTGLLDQNGLTLRKEVPCIKNYVGMGRSLRTMHEILLLAYKKKETMFCLQNLSEPDVFFYNVQNLDDLVIFEDKWKHPRANNRIHDSEKPLSITLKMIELCTRVGDIILEPFAGSFPSGLANTKYKLGRKVLGIEKDKKILDKTVNYFKEQTGLNMNVIELEEWQ